MCECGLARAEQGVLKREEEKKEEMRAVVVLVKAQKTRHKIKEVMGSSL
jgi:hypothetical protein